MDSIEQFQQTIYKYYKNSVSSNFPEILLDGVTRKLASDFHDQYSRFRIQYPKSIKRYSTFQIMDLEHPQTIETIINFLKSKVSSKYIDYGAELLKMSNSEVVKFELDQKKFYDMF